MNDKSTGKKLCKVCGCEYLFHGLLCKPCYKGYHRNKYYEYKMKVLKREVAIPESKICISCEKTLDSSKFYKLKSSEDGLASYCSSCIKKRKQSYRVSKYPESPVYKALESWDFTTHKKDVIKVPYFKGTYNKAEIRGFFYADADWLTVIRNLMFIKSRRYVILHLSKYNRWVFGMPTGDGEGKGYHFAHRFLKGLGQTKELDLLVDHINGFTLDNRSVNLRLCTKEENNRNTKVCNSSCRYRGVSLHKGGERPEGKYKAAIAYKKKLMHLGVFKTAEEAAKAYNEAALKYHGEFASLNKIPTNE